MVSGRGTIDREIEWAVDYREIEWAVDYREIEWAVDYREMSRSRGGGNLI